MLNNLRLLQTPLLRRLRLPQGSRIPSGRPVDVPLYPLLEDFTAQERPKTAQVSPKSPPRRLQNRILAIWSRILQVIFAIFGHLGAKIASRRQLRPNLAQLGVNLAASWNSRPPKTMYFPMVFEGFCYFNDLLLKTLKQGSRWSQDGSKSPQEGL